MHQGACTSTHGDGPPVGRSLVHTCKRASSAVVRRTGTCMSLARSSIMMLLASWRLTGVSYTWLGSLAWPTNIKDRQEYRGTRRAPVAVSLLGFVLGRCYRRRHRRRRRRFLHVVVTLLACPSWWPNRLFQTNRPSAPSAAASASASSCAASAAAAAEEGHISYPHLVSGQTTAAVDILCMHP